MISVTYWKLDQNPRCALPAISLRYVALAPYSPPTLTPCIMRAITSSAGAAMPMLAYDGVIAISSEPAHISSTDAVSALRRPCRSA